MKGFKHFGVMLDVSRNGVMKKDTLFSFIDLIAKMGYDTLELYSEDIYKLKDRPYFGYMRGGYSVDELKEIDQYCLKKNIELIPCIQTLAHFTNPSKEKDFIPMLDIDDILLVDDPKTYEFIEDMIRTAREAFSSKHLNIGMDEAYNLGKGNFQRKNGYEDQTSIMLRHLNKVTEIAKKYGFTCHMWGDMFVRMANDGHYLDKKPDVSKLKEQKISLPNNVEPAYWDYCTTSQDSCEFFLNYFKNFQQDVWFVGGACCWKGYTPTNYKSLQSCEISFKAMQKEPVSNYLITLWGDDGRETSPFMVLPVLFAAKEFAQGNFDHEKIKQKFQEELHLSFDDFLHFDDSSAGYKNGERCFDTDGLAKCLLFQDPLMGIYDKAYMELDPIHYEMIAKELREATERNAPYAYLFKEGAALASLLAVKSSLGIKTHQAYKKGKEELDKLLPLYTSCIRRLEIFHAAFEEMWMKENKPFGYEIVDIRLGGLRSRLLYAKKRIAQFLSGEIDRIEELECEQLLPFREESLMVSHYKWIISTSNI